MKIICINGQGGVGKDTFVGFCGTQEMGVYNFSMIDCIKNLATSVGWKGTKNLKDRKFLAELKELVINYNDYPFVDVLNKIGMAIHNHEWYMWKTGIKKELVCFIHSRETEDIQRWRDQYGAKALLIRRKEIEGDYGNPSDNGVFDIDYDYIVYNNGDLLHLRKEAQTFMEIIESETWESHI